MEKTELKGFELEPKKDGKGYDLVAYFIDGGVYWAAEFEEKPSVEAWHEVADELWGLVEEAYSDDRNYGLAFYACGYDGQAQTEFARGFKENFGAYVF